MKRTLLFILSLVLLLSCSKSNREEEIVNPGGDGGGTYEGIYIETETGVIDAHEYILNVPSVGGEYDFKLLGLGPFWDKKGSGCDFVDVIQTGDGKKHNVDQYYKGTLHLTVHENMTDPIRSVICRISTIGYSRRANITVIQEKGF